MHGTRLPRTTSFWTAAGGCFLVTWTQTRTAGRCLWAIAGLGGCGAIYGSYARHFNLRLEPAEIAMHLIENWEDPEVRAYVQSFGWHAIFLGGALFLR